MIFIFKGEQHGKIRRGSFVCKIDLDIKGEIDAYCYDRAKFVIQDCLKANGLGIVSDSFQLKWSRKNRSRQ